MLETSTTTDRQQRRNITRAPKGTYIIYPANPFRTLDMLDLPDVEQVVAVLTPVRVVTNG